MTNTTFRGAALALAACALAPMARAGDIQCMTPVDVIGTEARIRAHDYSPVALLRNAPTSAMTIGYGMGQGRDFEIGLLDGAYSTGQPKPGGIDYGPQAADVGLAFLVRATPAAWIDGGTLADVFDLASLNIQISERVAAMGCAGDITVAFRITGHADDLKYSLYGQPAKVFASLSDAEVTLVGIYSNHDKANTFLSAGYSLRAEAFVNGRQFAGEVVDIALVDGATLQLSGTP